jgi:hypothetical protein
VRGTFAKVKEKSESGNEKWGEIQNLVLKTGVRSKPDDNSRPVMRTEAESFRDEMSHGAREPYRFL